MKNIIKIIKEISSDTKTDVFAVGGYVRDFLLNRHSCDLDLVVSKSANGFAKRLAEAVAGKSFLLHGDGQVYRVAVFNDKNLKYVDISLMQGRTIDEDLQKRDFTVNALAVNINNFDNIKENLIDCSGGAKDLKKKEINVVYDKVFIDDPLRMLRAFRFACDCGFNVSKETLAYVKKYSDKIILSAPERIKNEFFRILVCKNASKYVLLMDDVKLLDKIFPVIIKMKKSAKNFYYHPKGLFQHCFQTLESLEKIFLKLDKYFPKSSKELLRHLEEKFSDNVDRTGLLKFVAIFHDCAKPECAKRMDKKIRFLGHEQLGAQKTSEIMKSLKMSNKEIAFAEAVISGHMRPSNLAKSEVITNRAQLRLFRDMKENTPDVLLLAMADWHSYKKLKVYSKKVLKQQEKSVAALIFNYFDSATKKTRKKLIDGSVLMKEFSLAPGKLIGELLKLVDIAAEEGKLEDKKQALAFAKSKLTVLMKKHKI